MFADFVFLWLSVSASWHSIHVSCSWNRWRYSWRRSMKTSRKYCVREESWSPNCWTHRTRYFHHSASAGLCQCSYNKCAQFSMCHLFWLERNCCWFSRGKIGKNRLGIMTLAWEECFVIQVSHRDVETEKRLKKDLKRTKVLLADAQIMLDHLKSNAPSKREIAQLKNQVRIPLYWQMMVWLCNKKKFGLIV